MTNTSFENQSPPFGESDSLKLHEISQLKKLSPVGELLHELLVTMNRSENDAEEVYQSALAAIRKNPVDSVIEIARLESLCPAFDYAMRSALIFAACELEHHAALPLLRSVVLTPIPLEAAKDPQNSTVAEETIIRTTAVDGVSILAHDGDKNVINILFEFLEIPSFSIRRASVQGLLRSAHGNDLRERIVECLPKDQRFLLDLKKMDVRKVSQIDNPERHLNEKGKLDMKPPAPNFDVRGRREKDKGREGAQSAGAHKKCCEDDPASSPTAK